MCAYEVSLEKGWWNELVCLFPGAKLLVEDDWKNLGKNISKVHIKVKFFQSVCILFCETGKKRGAE
ncbi:MAG: hypothetical protein WAL98_22015 [Desulfatiglandaceae bacterium]